MGEGPKIVWQIVSKERKRIKSYWTILIQKKKKSPPSLRRYGFRGARRQGLKSWDIKGKKFVVNPKQLSRTPMNHPKKA